MMDDISDLEAENDGNVPIDQPITPRVPTVTAFNREVAPVEIRPSDLSPARFAWLLAFSGLGDVWDAMEAATKGTDRATYAALVARRASRFFTLEDTLAAVTLFAPLAAQVAPEVDLSEAAIRDAWAQAEAVDI